MKLSVEYAIQRKVGGRFEDVDLFNTRTCRWKEPIEEWLDKIKECFVWRRGREKFATVRIVKRITIEEVVAKNDFKEKGKQ